MGETKDANNDFAARVLDWFDQHGRHDLPWQKDISPYRVWVSEIMLQQTQVQTVIPYFNAFMRSFPGVAELASASQDDVLAHWSGLGYYARARNLHRAAQRVCDEFGGEFPRTLDEVTSLPGIGESTAGAILSIACEQRHAILDGNVKRVLARHAAVAGWPGKTSVASELWQHALQRTPETRVASYTQAIMDLGATLCRRSRPACERCPVNSDCQALLTDTVADYPGRKPKKSKPLRKTTMLIASNGSEVFLQRRPETGIWGGLWSLPELGEHTPEEWCREQFGSDATELSEWQQLRHSFSHYDLDILPLLMRIDAEPRTVADTANVAWHAIDNEPPGGIAAPVRKLLDQLKDVSKR